MARATSDPPTDCKSHCQGHAKESRRPEAPIVARASRPSWNPHPLSLQDPGGTCLNVSYIFQCFLGGGRGLKNVAYI